VVRVGKHSCTRVLYTIASHLQRAGQVDGAARLGCSGREGGGDGEGYDPKRRATIHIAAKEQQSFSLVGLPLLCLRG
jgi:hypothetical protein